MSGDKIKRVRAVRKWLEMAEDSYQSHKELNGEIHLIFARAEMERLKETHHESNVLKWIFRFGAFGTAVLLLGVLWMGQGYISEERTAPAVSVIQQETNRSSSEEDRNLLNKNVSESASDSSADTNVVKEDFREESAEQKTVAESISREKTSDMHPGLSDQEIQMVVGEASRTLRGRN